MRYGVKIWSAGCLREKEKEENSEETSWIEQMEGVCLCVVDSGGKGPWSVPQEGATA